ncbi:MAG TPA: hypothetical protein DEF35_19385 [Paenibacillus sp.]|uniref:hypothetical protein n=1 Tax=Paenibacillus TaxID=44249 RepID=UPI000BA177DA|nr:MULTISPECIES: hypothetical protein [Paenibacillus]OZQ71309.1 hypothetical protein CA599_10070 [Paenibacillus taichungensis]HBU83780.1 hypothetical protein [Paenibacillus sp.]
MRKYRMLLLYSAILVLATGCQGWFNSIPKDTVMIKKIVQEHKNSEIEYEGVLSQDAVKTLSVQAVDKFLNIKLALDHAQFEIMAVDQNKLKELLKETSQIAGQVTLEGMSQQRMQFTSDIQAITGGLYYVTLTSSEVPEESYDIVLNAKDGDVLKILRSYRGSRAMPRNSEEKVFDLADRFVEEHGSYPLTELTPQLDMTRWGSNVELYYTSKDNKTLKYCVVVNFSSNKVVGFSKDIMALLSYNSKR